MEVAIPDKTEFERKLAFLVAGGAAGLHVVSDFDKTLTMAHSADGKIVSSYSRLRNCPLVPKEYFEESMKLKDKFQPHEFDPKLPMDQKIELMQEWWETAWNNKVKFGLNMDMMKAVVRDPSLKMRDGIALFFRKLWENDVPFLIFSSGIGNVIDLKLKQVGLLTKNVHLIANFLEFDESGVAVDHNRPLITVFTKNEVSVKDYSYHSEIGERKNVLLLGDSLGDIGMSEGMEHDCVLKIGFLNKDNSDREAYEKAYDVLLLGDPDFSYVNELLVRIV